MQLCTIIPVYNNAATIRQVVEDVCAILSNVSNGSNDSNGSDVIVVNDGSTDGTGGILEALVNDAATVGNGKNITIVGYAKNRGKGYALMQGFRTAIAKGYTHAITIDADGQHFASDIPTLLAAAEDNPDGIVVGSRNLTEKNMPQKNTFANKFSNFWFRLQTAVNLPDTQCGFRLYTLSAISTRWPITSRYEAELELIVFAAWAGKKVTAVPIHVYYPAPEERVSHFRPSYDFTRISVLNTILCVLAIVYGYPAKIIRYIIKKLA